MTERLAYSFAEAAEAIGCSEWLVRKLTARGELPVVHLGGKRKVVPVKALEEYLTEQGRASVGSDAGAVA